MQTDSKMSNRTPVVKIRGNLFWFELKLCRYGKLYAGMLMDAKCKRVQDINIYAVLLK